MNPDDPTLFDVLGRAMVARIATVSRNGRPHVNPLYFVRGNGKIFLGTGDQTLAARNIRAQPAVTLLFDIESEPTDSRVLRLRGRGIVRTDAKTILWYVPRDLHKYIFNRRGLKNVLAHARPLPLVARFVISGARGKACVLEVQPEAAELLEAPDQVGPSLNLS